MTDPERLIASGSELERSLLLAAAAEKPSPALLAKMEHGLGFAQTATSALAAKLAVVAVGVALMGGAGAALLTEGGEAKASARPIAVPIAAPIAERLDALPVLAPVPELPPARLLPESDAQPTSSGELAVRAPVNPKKAGSAGDRLREEVALLDRVRAALRSGDDALARRLLESYARRFPNGALTPEARKLRRSARD